MLDEAIRLARDLGSGLLDLIYPPFCLVCGEASQDYLCAKCIEKIDVIKAPYCHKCGIPCEDYTCRECTGREFAFEYARCAGTYDGVLREAVHALKYDCHIFIAEPLAELMARCRSAVGLPHGIDMVIPVPIHHSRLTERGFNQAAELALRLCRRTALPFEPMLLRKTKKTRHQVDLGQDERAVNVVGAFSVSDRDRVVGKRTLLVDDVFTTGATLNDAARALREAGASSVYAYCLARSL